MSEHRCEGMPENTRLVPSAIPMHKWMLKGEENSVVEDFFLLDIKFCPFCGEELDG